MIKEIFLPEKTKSRRLISQRILGLSIQESSINAALVYATPRGTFVENLLEEHIPPGAPGSYAERAGEALKTLLAKCPKYHQIRVSIPSAIVTFKELTLPFTDIEKIRMVVEYEVEPLLPFSIQESVVDFIVTGQNKEEKTSQILVAAVRTQDLQSIFDVYVAAGVDTDCITVDLFSLYGLYLQIEEYQKIAGASALVDIGATSTSVAFLLDGQMRLIRNISKGIKTIAEHISKDLNISVEEAQQHLVSFGKDKPDDEKYSQAAQKYLTTFMTDIQFTLNSFSLKLTFYESISKILFIGQGGAIKGFMEFSHDLLQIPCERFDCEKLFVNKQFKNKTKKLTPNWQKHVVTLGTAMVYTPHDGFNLRKKEFARTRFPLATKQIVTAGILTIMLFLMLGLRGFFQIRHLNNIAYKQNKRAISKLKKIFPPKHSALKKKALRPLFRSAQKLIGEREQAWQPILQENLQPLQILKDLTQTMDKRTFNIKIDKISIELEEDLGVPEIEVTGLFASQQGRHFSDYGNFIKLFDQTSTLLAIKEDEPESVEEGVKFSLILKVKEVKDE